MHIKPFRGGRGRQREGLPDLAGPGAETAVADKSSVAWVNAVDRWCLVQVLRWSEHHGVARLAPEV